VLEGERGYFSEDEDVALHCMALFWVSRELVSFMASYVFMS